MALMTDGDRTRGALAHGPTLADHSAPGAVALGSGSARGVVKESDRLAAGAPAGDYVVDAFLGAGAMGEVYAGLHPVIGKRVAIKVLKRELSASPEAAERFTREARAVNHVDHPNVIDVFAFGRLADGRLYLVMDLVEGRSLRAAIADGSLAPPAILDILAQIASALDAAHGKGVVHRDLKPDNVMLGPGDKVFVLDFGLAKLAASSALATATLTEQGTWLGTPGYMAPEAWSADGAGPASDRYALGVMAYELLSGTLPFTAKTLPQMMEQHFRAPIPTLKGAKPSPLDSVLARAMAKDPDERFASAADFVAALRSGKGLAAKRRGSSKLVVPAIAGGLVVAAGAAFIAMGGGREPARDTARPAIDPRAADEVLVDVDTNPHGASVYRIDGGTTKLVGAAPTKLYLQPEESMTVVARRGGFRPERTIIKGSDGRRTIRMVPMNGFVGAWMLPDGNLRAYRRADDDHVDVYKLAAVAAEPVFYRRFTLEETEAGVTFAAVEELSEGSDASCQVSFRVAYHFDADTDTLEVVQEHIDLSKRDGKCLVHDRWPGTPTVLKRVDATDRGEVRTIVAPVAAPPRPSNTDLEREKKARLMAEERAKKGKGKKPSSKPVTPEPNASIGNVDAPLNRVGPPIQPATVPQQEQTQLPNQRPQQANPPPAQSNRAPGEAK